MKMSKEKIDVSMFAPCGMNCKVYYKHCYHKKNLCRLFEQRQRKTGAKDKKQAEIK